jgi:adenylate cyclase
MHRLLFLVLFISTFTISTAQEADPQIDSLKRILRQQKEDTLKVNTLLQIGSLYLNADLNEAILFGTEAQVLAERINFKRGLGFAHKLLGQSQSYLANYTEAAVQFKLAQEAFEEIQFKEGICNMLSNLGSIYFLLADDAKAIEYHLQSLKIAEEINNRYRIATSLNNIGTVYVKKVATADKAIEYFFQALPIFTELDDAYGIGTVSTNIGEIYFKNIKYDSALQYFDNAIKYFSNSADAPFPLSYKGAIYAEKKDFDKAVSFHNQAIEIAENLGAKLELSQSLLSMGSTLEKKGDLLNAIAAYKNAQKISEEIKAKEEIKLTYEALAHAFAKLGDFKNAYTYESLLTRIKDTLYNVDEGKKIQQLQFNFDIDKKQNEISLLTKDKELQEASLQRQRIVSWAAGITGVLLLFVVGGIYNRYKYVRKTTKIIQDERDRSKELLLNILPEETARELEIDGAAKTRYYESVTVLFTDFKGFSTIAGKLSPQELVSALNDYFIAFDEIVEKYGLEKIKTIGDAYMCAGGIPVTNDTHPLDAVQAALEMQVFMKQKNNELQEIGLEGWELRVGIHTGPIVAGVVGKKKYAYDIWGDTVNIASRMESNGEAGKVNISSSTYTLIRDKYECLHRGKISAKNIGEVDMYYVGKEMVADLV